MAIIGSGGIGGAIAGRAVSGRMTVRLGRRDPAQAHALPGELGNDPHADEVPTEEDAVKQAWQRKVQQAKTVLQDFEDWKKPQKPAKGR